jgi:hypothetical protein
MVDTTLLLHANLLYAEFPFAEIPNVVDKSYLPVLEMLEKNPQYKIVLNVTGFTLDVLSGAFPEYGRYPEVIDLIKVLVKRGQIELTGTSWTHAILPLMTTEDVRRDIARYLATVKRVLGVRPAGFFPPELSIDPLLPSILSENGFSWCFVDNGLLRYTTEGLLNVANDFKPVPPSLFKEIATASRKGPLRQLGMLMKLKKSIRSLTDISPVVWNGAGATSIVAFRSVQQWNSYTLSCLGRMAIMNEKRLYKMLDAVVPTLSGFFLPFSTDFEFYGYRGNVLEESIPISRLAALLEYIHKSPHLTFTLPSEYLKKTDTSTLTDLYLRTGSWSTDADFALWDTDPDNRRLNDFVREVRDLFERRGGALSKADREIVEKYLLLAQGSDGRGWTPIPEHRLFCYNAALKAHTILRGK